MIMRRGSRIGTFSLLPCLYYFKQSLIDMNSFRLSKLLYSQYFVFKHTTNVSFVFPK